MNWVIICLCRVSQAWELWEWCRSTHCLRLSDVAGSDQWMYGPDLTVRQTPPRLIIKSTHPQPPPPTHTHTHTWTVKCLPTVQSQYWDWWGDEEVSHLTRLNTHFYLCLAGFKHPLRPAQIDTRGLLCWKTSRQRNVKRIKIEWVELLVQLLKVTVSSWKWRKYSIDNCWPEILITNGTEICLTLRSGEECCTAAWDVKPRQTSGNKEWLSARNGSILKLSPQCQMGPNIAHQEVGQFCPRFLMFILFLDSFDQSH